VAGEKVASALRAPEEAAAIDGALTWLAADASRSLITLADATIRRFFFSFPTRRRCCTCTVAANCSASLRWRSRQSQREPTGRSQRRGVRGSSCPMRLDDRERSGARYRRRCAPRARSVQKAATIALLGTGADVVYPASNRTLSDRIAQHGLLISEYPLGTPAVPHNFPRRNRLDRRAGPRSSGGRSRAALGLADHGAAWPPSSARGDGDSRLDPFASGARLPPA